MLIIQRVWNSFTVIPRSVFIAEGGRRVWPAVPFNGSFHSHGWAWYSFLISWIAWRIIFFLSLQVLRWPIPIGPSCVHTIARLLSCGFLPHVCLWWDFCCALLFLIATDIPSAVDLCPLVYDTLFAGFFLCLIICMMCLVPYPHINYCFLFRNLCILVVSFSLMVLRLYVRWMDGSCLCYMDGWFMFM